LSPNIPEDNSTPTNISINIRIHIVSKNIENQGIKPNIQIKLTNCPLKNRLNRISAVNIKNSKRKVIVIWKRKVFVEVKVESLV